MRNTVAPMMAAKGLLPEYDDTKYNFLWVVDFPLFAKPEKDSVVASHPGPFAYLVRLYCFLMLVCF